MNSVHYSQDTSFLSTALIIPTKIIEDKLNQAIDNELFSDDDFENLNSKGNSDKLKIKINRWGKIIVTWQNNVATVKAPISLFIERRIIEQHVLPLQKELTLKTSFNLNLYFKIDVDISNDWKLLPKTKFVKIRWFSVSKSFTKMIGLQNNLDRRLKAKMPYVERRLDSLINRNVHLDQAMLKVWKKIQKPILASRNVQNLWLKINPIGFQLHKITSIHDSLYVHLRISANTQTFLVDKANYEIDSVLPPLLKTDTWEDSAYIHFLSEISFVDINKMISSKLLGKTFELSNHKLKILAAEMSACGSLVVLKLVVKGSFKATLYLQGKPAYSEGAQNLEIQDFDFEINTDEALYTCADWIRHSSFKQQIQDLLCLPITDRISKIPNAIINGLECSRSGESLNLELIKWEFKPINIWVKDSSLISLIIINAKAKIVLEKL
ncbi:MAG: DUF4403 family protein [Saprospiraceae bacterium]